MANTISKDAVFLLGCRTLYLLRLNFETTDKIDMHMHTYAYMYTQIYLNGDAHTVLKYKQIKGHI